MWPDAIGISGRITPEYAACRLSRAEFLFISAKDLTTKTALTMWRRNDGEVAASHTTLAKLLLAQPR